MDGGGKPLSSSSGKQGSSSQWAFASPKQRLKFHTVSGSKKTNSWKIRWMLTKKSKAGGWIVQHIHADFKAQGKFDYWEAWLVNANSRYTVFQKALPYDDEFGAISVGSHIEASARFYEGLRLTASFIFQSSAFPSGSLLPTATVNPHLPLSDATAADVRNWTKP